MDTGNIAGSPKPTPFRSPALVKVNDLGCNTPVQIISGQSKMYVSCLEAVLCAASQGDEHPAVSCKGRDVCVDPGWLCNSLTPDLPELSGTREKPGIWHNLVTLWASVSEHWLFHSCTKKRSKNPGLRVIFKPSGWLGTHPVWLHQLGTGMAVTPTLPFSFAFLAALTGVFVRKLTLPGRWKTESRK